jgi:AraC-like DNA-binding protein
VQFVLLAVHFATYSALSLHQLRRHGTAIGQVFSTIDRIELTWLKRLCQLVLALCAASLLMLLARIFLADRVSADSRLLPAAIVASLIYFVGLLSLRQPAIYRQSTLATGAEPGPGPDAHEPRKYQSSTLTAAEVDAHWQRLSIYMDAQKPYLTSGLTIGELAGNYGVPQAHLSQVINQSAGMTFFDFINRYRVDYARQLLREARSDLTVLDIGLEAGFNSQSTFYAQFKKWTGVTPSQYRKGASEE